MSDLYGIPLVEDASVDGAWLVPYRYVGDVMPRDADEALAWLLDDLFAPEYSPFWSPLYDADVRDVIRGWPVSERERARMVAWVSVTDRGWEERLAEYMAHHRRDCLCEWPGGEEGLAGWRD